MSEPGTAPWRRAEASRLISFGRAAALPDGGFGWLDVNGGIDPAQPRPLYINARMTYVFALAHLDGVAGADALAAAGIGAIADRYADGANGGWFSSLDPAGNVLDTTKANYAHAHVLLAAASALAAGVPGAGPVLEAAAAVIGRHFWSDAEGLARESWNAGFTESEPYRGANSNMHSVEAYLAAGDVTGDPVWHARAASIAGYLVNVQARAHAWRIPEHYDENWQPLPDYNADRPNDPFRPPGTTPGHSFEWARLLVTLEAAQPAPAAWLLEAATALFDTAVADAWQRDGHPGLIYTVDAGGQPVVTARMHWVACEAVLAADALHRRTGEDRFAAAAARWWDEIDRYFLDRQHGGWWQELAPDMTPATSTWSGKPDLYHSYQALLLPSLPLSPTAATALARRDPAPDPVTRLAAVLIAGPPATGKSTLAEALAPRLGAALLDLDVATAPLTRVISGLTGVHDLDDPALAGLTRAARYDTLLGLAAANLRAGRPVVLVAPFSTERAQPSAWVTTTRRLAAEPTLVWLHLPPDELVRRLTRRAEARDENKIRDPASFLTALDLAPPAVPHLPLDATQPTPAQLQAVLAHLSR